VSVSVFYKWKICEKAPGSDKCVDLSAEKLSQYVSTPLDGRNLVVKPNQLKGGLTYQFTCLGWRGKKGGSSGQASVDKIVNVKPIPGSCTVSPQSGIALNTSFTIKCQNWVDDDLPLTYTYGIVESKCSPFVLRIDQSRSQNQLFLYTCSTK